MRETFQLVEADALSERDWQSLARLRAACPGCHSPFLDPAFARAVAQVRPDTFIGLAFEDETLVAAWPLHVARDGWTRPAGAPFADWNGPLVAPGSTLTPARMIDALGLAGHTASNMTCRPGGPALHEETTRSLVTDLSAGGQATLDALVQDVTRAIIYHAGGGVFHSP